LVIYPNNPGLGCCQAELDDNPVSQLYQGIDLILTRGNIRDNTIALYGTDSSERTVHGLWPSDHAGVAAWLKLANSSN
jgi:hypothetical protein